MVENILNNLQWEYIIRILFAAGIGMIMGWERKKKGSMMGPRTFAIICLVSALTSCIQLELVEEMGVSGGDATRVAQGLLSSIGFILAGLIIKDNSDNHIYGLTTSAIAWGAAIIGICIGYGFYDLGVIAAIVILLINFIYSFGNK